MPLIVQSWLLNTAITGVIIWGAIKFNMPRCERNTLRNALVFAAILIGSLLIPLFGPLIAIILFFAGLLRFYDLEVGHVFAVLIIVVALEMFLFGLLIDLEDGEIYCPMFTE